MPLFLIWLAAAVIISTIFDRWTVSNIPTLRTLAGVFGVLLAICWALFRANDFRIRRGPMVWMLLFLLTIIYVDMMRYVQVGDVAFGNFMQWLQPVLFGLILIDIARDDRAAWYLFTALLISVFMLAVMAIFGVQHESGRVGAQAMNLNAQAYYFGLLVIPLYVFTVERWPRFSRTGIIILLAMTFLAFTLVRTGSRGGLAAAVVGLTIATTLLMRTRNTSAYVSMIPFVVLGGIIMVLSSNVAERWERTISGEDYGHRDVVWAVALDMVKESPILGHGAGFITELGDATRGKDTTTHNQYLMLLVAYGICGLIAWLGIVLSVLRRCWQFRSHPIAAALLGMIVCSMVYAIPGDLTFKRYFWVVIALAANVDVIVRAYPVSARPAQATNRQTRHPAGIFLERP